MLRPRQVASKNAALRETPMPRGVVEVRDSLSAPFKVTILTLVRTAEA